MTVSSSTNRVSYSGNGTLTTFAYTFKVFDQGDLTVILRASNGAETVQTITTDYTVTGVGDVGGGNVVFTTAPTATETVVILREQGLTQGLDLVPNDPFPAQSLEESLDKLTFMVQQHNEELGRAIKASRTNVITGSEFTISAADRANKVFSFDASGDLAVTQELGVWQGDWATSTAFSVRDIVKDASNNNVYICITAHTSSGSTPISTNTDSAKWALLVDAASASSSATAAAASETAAETAQTAAEAAQTAAETAQTAAETAETNAETAETNAETAQAAAELVYDNFDDRYLGAKSTSGGDPTLDNDGDALIDGALFFDTTNNVMKVYNLGTTTWLRTTPTTSDQADITTLAGIDTDIQTLADIEDGTTATNALSNAGNASTEIVTVAGQITPTNNISTVAGLSSDITIVSGISANVTSVAGVSTDVTTVAGQISPTNNLSTVAGIASNVSTVAGISSDVTTTAGLSTDIGTLADIEDGTTATNAISNVGNNTANITTVAGQISPTNNISSLAAISSEISSVGGSISNVNIVATNISDVNNFAETYRIGATDPTTSLDTGDLFFNTSSGVLKVYNGSAWEAGVTAGSGFMPLTGGTFTGDVTFGDNDKAIFGAGSDLNIYHDGSDSYVEESGAGNLYLSGQNHIFLTNSDQTQTYAAFNAPTGWAKLYYSNAEKLATTSTGVDITGNLLVTGNAEAIVNIQGTTAGGSFVNFGDNTDANVGQIGYDHTSNYMRFKTNDTERMRITSSGNVGIGTSSPTNQLHVASTANSSIRISAGTSGNNDAKLVLDGNGSGVCTIDADKHLTFTYSGTERMRIDSSGNLLVGKTATDSNVVGAELNPAGIVFATRDSNVSALLNRKTSDGDIAVFQKDGSTVGSIGTEGGSGFDAMYIANGDAGLIFQGYANDAIIPFDGSTLDKRDAAIDLGYASGRFKDLYLSGGVVETTTTVTYASSIALTYNNGSIQTVTLTGNVTFTDSLADGEAIVLMLNAGASYTVTWTAVDKWVSSSGNAAPTLTANDTIVLWKIGSTVYAAYAGSYT